MDYSKTWPNLDESQTMLMDQIHQFAQKVVAPVAAHHDESGEFPTENVKQMAEMGLMGMMVEEKWGGAGLDTLTYAMAMESISAACASTGVIMSVNNSLVCYPIQAFGTDAQKEKFLKQTTVPGPFGVPMATNVQTGSHNNFFSNPLSYIHDHIGFLNSSKFFAGIVMILLNVGSKVVSIQFSKST